MKKALILYGILLTLYIVSLIRMKMTLFEMEIWYLYYAILFGVPFFIGYLLLIIARHKYTERGFIVVIFALIALAALGITILNVI